MLRFAANLSMLYPEHGFLDRFAAAARDGFKAVEFMFAYDFAAKDIALAAQDAGVDVVLMNAPPGGQDTHSISSAWAQGARGTACLPGREVEFQNGVLLALEYAQTLNCPCIHVLAGVVPPEHQATSALPLALQTSHAYASTASALRDKFSSNLRWAAAQAAVEVVHDMGYGATARHVESIVTEIYNELTAAGHADNTIPGKGWQVLAERLNAIAR